MSETEFTTEAAEPVVDGQFAGDETTATPQEVEFFDVDSYGDKYVRVTVDGEEIEVPLKEAVSGYQRQADYTRKTQELAEQRRQVQFAQAIQQALDNDPQATIDLLKNHYGIDATESFSEEDDIFADPMEKQYKQLESRIRSFEERQAYEELERTVQSLQTRYGDAFDANEVVSAALARGTTDLESVYKQIAFDRIYSQSAAQKAVQARQSEQEKQIVEAKRQAAVVTSGGSAQNTSSGTGSISSLRDAFAAAKQQLGISQI